MQNILIVEDNKTQLGILEDTICTHYPNWNVQITDNFLSAKTMLEHSIETNALFSLFLFDIQLSLEEGDRGGFFLAKEVRKHASYYRTPILFLTAISDEGAFALSEFHCYNYITKPYTSTDILRQLEQMLITGYLEHSIEITDTNRIHHKIRISEIYMVESKSHTLTICSKNGNFITRQYSLEKILEILGSDFIQCHRKIIVNKTYITSYDKASQYITVDNTSIPVGRTYIKNLEHYI